MEFDFSEILENQSQTEKEIMNGKLNFLYRYKNMSKNQKEFTKHLLKNILKNQASLFEFSPTLDKLFIICSSLLTILNYQQNEFAKIERKFKFILLVKTEDIIFEALNNFKEIANLSKYSHNKYFPHKIIPFLDRKITCINEKALENASALDFDTFCNSYTSSWIEQNKQCSSFKNFLNLQNDNTDQIIKSNIQNVPSSLIVNQQQIIENSISIIKTYPKIKIKYESDNTNNENNNSNNIKYEFFNLFNHLGETNICPFYYFNSLINEGNADLIICTYKDFFDQKNRIKIKNLIPVDERINYKLIFDECGDIDYVLQDFFSMNIDDNILQFTSDDVFILRENYRKFMEKKDDIEMNINENSKESKIKRLFVENEFLEFNGFSRNFLDNRLKEKFDFSFTFINNKPTKEQHEKINEINYCDLIKYFPGDIRNDESFLNLISKLVYFFGRILSQKTEYIFNVYHLQHFLLKEWIDFRTLKALNTRLIFFLNKIKFANYEE